MVKRINASKKYYIVLFLVTIIAIGFIVYLNKQFIVNILLNQSTTPAINEAEARVVFDVYSITVEDANGKWKETMTAPRVVDYGNASVEAAFKNETFMEIDNSVYQFNKDDFVLIAEGKTLDEANDIIDRIVAENDVEDSGIAGSSQVSPRSYIFKNAIFSGVFDFYSTGGVHPITSAITINYDLLNHQPIWLHDILNIGYEDIEKLLDLEQNKLNLLSSGETDKINCSKEELAPNGFSVTGNELVIFISPYLTNTYCPESFKFEYPAIKEIIKKDGPLARIIKK